MHKTHIFDQKNNAKSFYRPTYPIFSGPLQETNHIFLGLKGTMEIAISICVIATPCLKKEYT